MFLNFFVGNEIIISLKLSVAIFRRVLMDFLYLWRWVFFAWPGWWTDLRAHVRGSCLMCCFRIYIFVDLIFELFLNHGLFCGLVPWSSYEPSIIQIGSMWWLIVHGCFFSSYYLIIVWSINFGVKANNRLHGLQALDFWNMTWSNSSI